MNNLRELNDEGCSFSLREIDGSNPFQHALEYNPPARGVWNIVHIGMLLPESHEVFVCPESCMRGVVLTSGENMSIYAAANIVTAVSSFHDRGYAKLGGVILNRRGVENEDAKVNEFVKEIGSVLVGTLDRSPLVQKADDMGKTVVEAFPESDMTVQYDKLADAVLQCCRKME